MGRLKTTEERQRKAMQRKAAEKAYKEQMIRLKASASVTADATPDKVEVK